MNNYTPSKTAFVFPGQGSQSAGMGKELAEHYPAAKNIYKIADEILGYSLSSVCWNSEGDELNKTEITQPALFVHSFAAHAVLKSEYPDFQPAYMAGHSLGQLSALAAAGAFSFEDGLKLVQRRGELMAQAGEVSPGGMAALLGLDIETVESLMDEASEGDELVQVANDNCPGQVVISGHSAAVERAMEAAKAAGAKRALPIAVSVAAHSYLMSHAQAEFNQAVANTPITTPTVPVIGNVSAKPITTEDSIRADLQAQLTSRVRWTETIQYLNAQGIETYFEVGTGNVLCGLIRRIDTEAVRINVGSPETIENLV